MEIEVEWAITEDNVVFPSFDMLYPKPKIEANMVDYIEVELKIFKNKCLKTFIRMLWRGIKGWCGMFTSLGKPRVKAKGANSSVGLFSEETIQELATGSSHGYVEQYIFSVCNEIIMLYFQRI